MPQAHASATSSEPLAEPAAAAAKAANSILPSRPRSTTPERSASRPASAHRMSGVATRRVEAISVPMRTVSISNSADASRSRLGRARG